MTIFQYIITSILSINVLLLFDMHDLNGISNAAHFSDLSFSFAAAAKRSFIPFTTIYATLYSHKSDLNKGHLNLICLLREHRLTDKSFFSIHVLITTFDAVELFNNLDFLC